MWTKPSDHDPAVRVPTGRHGTGKRWQARVKNPDGRWVSKLFDRKAEAEAWEASVQTDVRRGDYLDPSGGRTLLVTFGEDYIASAGVDESTRKTKSEAWRVRVAPTFGRREVGTIKPTDVRAWVRGLEGRYSPLVVRLTHALLREVLDAAVEDGLVRANPARAKIARPTKVEAERLRIWSAADLDRLVEATTPHARAMIVLGYTTGLRVGELIALSPDDVDFLRGTVTVTTTAKVAWANVIGDGPKTTSSRRTVPVPESTRLVLAEHMRYWPPRCARVHLEHPDGAEVDRRFLFGPAKSTNVWNYPTLHTRVWQPASRLAKLPDYGYAWHGLRHHYASRLIAGGLDVVTVSTLLGHKNAQTTLHHYAHLFEDAEDRSRRVVEQAFPVDRGEDAQAAT
jgi:integrase